MQMKSVFETKMQRQHELSEVKRRKILPLLAFIYEKFDKEMDIFLYPR